MATKKNTASKTAPAKKVAAPKRPAPLARKSATKSAPKASKKVEEKKAPAKKPAKKVEAAPVVEKKPAKKVEAAPVVEKKPAKKSTPKPTVVEAPQPETSTPEVVKPVGMRTPTVKPTVVGKPAGALKPNYGLIHPKFDGKKSGSVRQATRSPFKDSDLEEFKRRLLVEREKKVKLQNAMSSDALSRPDEENVEEDGTNSSNRADMLQRAEETRKSLRAIDDALRAIENKTYGVCSVCKCAISRERLRAAPFAIRCVKCKEEWERQVKASKRSMQ